MSPLGTSATILLIVPALGDQYGAAGGMRIDRGTEALGGKQPQCDFVGHKFHIT
jgi:hypothetical protein